MSNRMTIEECSQRLGVPKQFLRVALQQNEFSWGHAIRTSKNRFTYYINRKMFEETEGV